MESIRALEKDKPSRYLGSSTAWLPPQAPALDGSHPKYTEIPELRVITSQRLPLRGTYYPGSEAYNYVW